MRTSLTRAVFLACFAITGVIAFPAALAAQQTTPAAPEPADSAPHIATGSDPALTIYNGGYAVVRETLQLNLEAGINPVSVSGMTTTLEPDSVILRDPSGRRELSVLEQSYRNDPVSQARLLQLFEGQTIPFLVERGDAVTRVMGRIVRSGYVAARYGSSRGYPSQAQPVIEVAGELRFSLPGLPVFPSLGDDSVLQPTLSWQLHSDTAGTVAAEVAYITGGFTWDADYNAVSKEGSEVLDLSGWITMLNTSGKTFREARIKFMAGDVAKVSGSGGHGGARSGGLSGASYRAGPAVTERSFADYHLYSVARPLTLRDGETKQVEMVSAEGIPVTRHYVYDGAAPYGKPADVWWVGDNRMRTDYGALGHDKVWVLQEFRNDEASGLGVPLPAGRVRFYTRDADGQLEFTGESLIDHTPRDESLSLYTGNAFDLVGERIRTSVELDRSRDLHEAFSISLRNHKDEAVNITVVEHLYRWVNWEIRASSHPYEKLESRTIAFDVEVPANGEVTIEYDVHYSW